MIRNKGNRTVIYLSDDMVEAMKAYIKTSGGTVTGLIREAVSAKLSRPDLAEPPPMGRPRKVEVDMRAETDMDATADMTAEVDMINETPMNATRRLPPKKVARAASGKKVTAPKKATRKGSQ